MRVVEEEEEDEEREEDEEGGKLKFGYLMEMKELEE